MGLRKAGDFTDAIADGIFGDQDDGHMFGDYHMALHLMDAGAHTPLRAMECTR